MYVDLQYLAHQPKHRHVFGLPNPVRSVLGLLVERRVPIHVKDDHFGGRLQVDPHPPRFGRAQEHERRHAGVEAIHQVLPGFGGGGAVQTGERPPVGLAEGPEHV